MSFGNDLEYYLLMESVRVGFLEVLQGCRETKGKAKVSENEIGASQKEGTKLSLGLGIVIFYGPCCVSPDEQDFRS